MRGGGGADGDEDPAVEVVEEILSKFALHVGDHARPGGPLQVVHALWICACVSVEDAPIWLVYDQPDGTLRWSRKPDETAISDMIEPMFIAGGHADPRAVLDWLRGDARDPWGGDTAGWGDREVSSTLMPRLLTQD